MNKNELDAEELRLASSIVENSKKAWDGPVDSAWNEFDITKHEWFDSGVEDVSIGENSIYLGIDSGEYYGAKIEHNKADAIAIAKHFKLNP